MIRRRISAVFRRVSGLLRTHREGLRSLLLVVLVVTLVVQSGALWSRVLTRDSIPWSGLRARSAASAQAGQGTDNSAGAVPIRFAARGKDGLYGIQYNTDGLKIAYEDTADVWAQALENAENPTQSNVGQYRTALQQEMLLMEYDGSVPLHIIAGWLGMELPKALDNCIIGAAALCRSADNTYTLYLRDSTDGSLACAQTAVEDSLFDAAVGQFEPNDCLLAADQDDAVVSPDLLYFPGGETFAVVSFQAYNGSDGLEDLLAAFDLDADVAVDNAYTTDGVTVYVSGSNAVRMAEDGSMRYDGTGVGVTASSGHDQLMQYVQTGYELTGAVLDAIDSGASASMTSAYTDSDTGRYIVVYGLQIGGVPVDNNVTGYFARYEFEGGELVHADLALRTCQTTGETVAVMPEKQAAAALDSAADAVLSLRYVDKAVGTSSSWEQLYDEDDDALWNVENQENPDADTAWNDNLDDTGDSEEEDGLDTPWYDSTDTPVSPRWYALRYGSTDSMPHIGRTLSPDEIVVKQADFDRMIQEGGVS